MSMKPELKKITQETFDEAVQVRNLLCFGRFFLSLAARTKGGKLPLAKIFLSD